MTLDDFMKKNVKYRPSSDGKMRVSPQPGKNPNPRYNNPKTNPIQLKPQDLSKTKGPKLIPSLESPKSIKNRLQRGPRLNTI